MSSSPNLTNMIACVTSNMLRLYYCLQAISWHYLVIHHDGTLSDVWPLIK